MSISDCPSAEQPAPYTRPTQLSETQARLKTMLTQAGFDWKTPDPQLAWEVFKSFVQELVEGIEAGGGFDRDGVLFEYGTFDFTGKILFTWQFTRQLTVDVLHEGDHMEQLQLTFRCAPTDELSELKATLWSFDFDTLPEYFAKVEAMEEFKRVLRSPQNWSCEVMQMEV